jgi:hypothetical protein
MEDLMATLTEGLSDYNHVQSIGLKGTPDRMCFKALSTAMHKRMQIMERKNLATNFISVK